MFEDRDKGRDRVRHVDTDGDTNLLTFCLSRAHAIVPQQTAIIQKDPKFRVFEENRLWSTLNGQVTVTHEVKILSSDLSSPVEEMTKYMALRPDRYMQVVRTWTTRVNQISPCTVVWAYHMSW